MTESGRMFYETTSFPIHRAHVPNHPTHQQHTRFLSGCNSSQQWCQGRNVPFPGVDPDEWGPAGILHPSYGMGAYQYPAWYTDFLSYTRWIYDDTPATITASFAGRYLGIQLPNAAGAFTVRQEWAVNKLRKAYEPHPGAITESELRGLILDRQDPHAHYLAFLVHPVYQRTWFDDLIVHHPAATSPPEYDLLLEFKLWAEGGAQLDANNGTPAKWHIFWYYFREDGDSHLNLVAPANVRGFLYNFPSIQAYRFASQYSYVLDAANRALTLTLDALQYHPNLRLQDMLYVRVPFTTSLYATTGGSDTLRTVWLGAWTTQPGTIQVPRRPIVGGSRCAMLVRMYQSDEETHAVYISNFGVVADDESLPEWQVDQGARYRASIQNWAQGIDYLLPMTQAALQSENAPCYSFDYPYSSPPPCP